MAFRYLSHVIVDRAHAALADYFSSLLFRERGNDMGAATIEATEEYFQRHRFRHRLAPSRDHRDFHRRDVNVAAMGRKANLAHIRRDFFKREAGRTRPLSTGGAYVKLARDFEARFAAGDCRGENLHVGMLRYRPEIVNGVNIDFSDNDVNVPE